MARSLQTKYGIPAEQAGANRSFSVASRGLSNPGNKIETTEATEEHGGNSDLSLNFPRSRHFAGLFDSTNCLGYRVVDQRVHQSNLQSLRSVDLFRRSKELKRAGRSHNPREALRASPSRHQPECGAAMSEHGRGSRDAPATAQRQIQSSAHAVTLDGRVYRGREVFNREHQALSGFCELAGGGATERLNLREVGAGGKESFIARDDQGLWIGLQVSESVSQGQDSSRGQTIRAVIRREAQLVVLINGFDLEGIRHSSRMRSVHLAPRKRNSVLDVQIRQVPFRGLSGGARQVPATVPSVPAPPRKWPARDVWGYCDRSSPKSAVWETFFLLPLPLGKHHQNESRPDARLREPRKWPRGGTPSCRGMRSHGSRHSRR